ncbi:MAG: TIR domain-containing protein [Anaerolinea sp.]|nr:TIR domain-containing protein [Anaerolinea sp.]
MNSTVVSDTIFISYSRRDWDSHVRPLVERLRQAGYSVWVDQHLLQGGQDWRDEINHALDLCGRMILCVSPDALESKYVRLEYRYFLDENKPIIPIICREAKLLPELRVLQWLPYDFDALIGVLGAPTGVPMSTSFATSGGDPDTVVIKTPPPTIARTRITSANAAATRDLASLRGHDKPISSLSFSPDNRTLVSASADGMVRLWDTESRRELVSIANRDSLYDIEYSPDGHTLAAALGAKFGNTSSLVLTDVASRQPILTFGTHNTRLFEIVFSPDGAHIACACWDHLVTIWDIASAQQIAALAGHTGTVSSVVYSSDGAHIASGSWDGTIKLWDADTHHLIGTFTGHSDQVNSIALTADGQRLASVSADQTVRVWDTRSFEQVIPFNQGVPVWCAAFSPDGKVLATGDMKGAIKLWCMTDLRELVTLSAHQKPVLSLDFTSDGAILASGARDGTIKLWGIG